MNDQRLQDLYQISLAQRAGSPRADCPLPEQLLALARREGSEEARLRILDHAMSCEDCHRELALLRAIEKAGSRMTTHSSPAGRSRVLTWRVAGPLAMAACLVVAVGIALRGRDEHAIGEEPSRGAETRLVLHTPSTLELGRADSLVVAWRPEPAAARYVMEVLGADGRVILSVNTTDTTLVLRNLSRLETGREYRWWVRAMGAGDQRSSALGRLRVSAP